jgi:hypothetical protein
MNAGGMRPSANSGSQQIVERAWRAGGGAVIPIPLAADQASHLKPVADDISLLQDVPAADHRMTGANTSPGSI